MTFAVQNAIFSSMSLAIDSYIGSRIWTFLQFSKLSEHFPTSFRQWSEDILTNSDVTFNFNQLQHCQIRKQYPISSTMPLHHHYTACYISEWYSIKIGYATRWRYHEILASGKYSISRFLRISNSRPWTRALHLLFNTVGERIAILELGS